MSLKIKKNDTVEVMTGNDAKKRGRVLQVIPKDNACMVENINVSVKHLRKSQQNPQGGRTNKEMPIPMSNVRLVCPKCDKGVRFSVTVNEQGNKVRVCKKCNQSLD